jgi:hypothetical protein
MQSSGTTQSTIKKKRLKSGNWGQEWILSIGIAMPHKTSMHKYTPEVTPVHFKWHIFEVDLGNKENLNFHMKRV